jgi:hypothetical protein
VGSVTTFSLCVHTQHAATCRLGRYPDSYRPPTTQLPPSCNPPTTHLPPTFQDSACRYPPALAASYHPATNQLPPTYHPPTTQLPPTLFPGLGMPLPAGLGSHVHHHAGMGMFVPGFPFSPNTLGGPGGFNRLLLSVTFVGYCCRLLSVTIWRGMGMCQASRSHRILSEAQVCARICVVGALVALNPKTLHPITVNPKP